MFKQYTTHQGINYLKIHYWPGLPKLTIFNINRTPFSVPFFVYMQIEE